jgi:hypothetical protein
MVRPSPFHSFEHICETSAKARESSRPLASSQAIDDRKILQQIHPNLQQRPKHRVTSGSSQSGGRKQTAYDSKIVSSCRRVVE